MVDSAILFGAITIWAVTLLDVPRWLRPKKLHRVHQGIDVEQLLNQGAVRAKGQQDIVRLFFS